MSIDLPSLSLGGNVFGWTADEPTSFAVLDAALAAGITFVDSADVYAAWANDGRGGQSEEILGRWVKDRGVRDQVLIATKGGKLPALQGIRPDTLEQALEGSLARLGVDVIDLYYAHADDGGDLTDTLHTFDGWIKQGKVRAYGLSNFDVARVREAVAVAERDGLARPSALQPEYSLVERGVEAELVPVAADLGIPLVPYYALASGFLTGKYRPGDADGGGSVRAGSAAAYLDEPRGPAVLEALDAAAQAHDVPLAAVAIAWLRAQPTVVAPIASARTVEQIEPLAASLDLELSAAELDALTAASELGVGAAR